MEESESDTDIQTDSVRDMEESEPDTDIQRERVRDMEEWYTNLK